MVHQDQRLIRLDPRLLRRRIGEELRVPHHVLVQRLAARHQHADRRLLAPPGATEALPGLGDRARVAVEHHHIQAADIHAQLQRRGADDPVHPARAHLPLHLAPLGGQVTTAVGADPPRLARVAVEHLLQVLGQHLHHQPGLAEHQGLEPGADRQPRNPVGLRPRRGAQAEIGIHHRRVPQQDVLGTAGRAAVADCFQLILDQRAAVLGGVADGGRAQDELRAHTVERAYPLEPADHVGHVGAEHATVGVDLVDHHVAQVLEELRPLGVVRQDRLVEHVRIADHDVAVDADRLARIARGVAVEGGRAKPEAAGGVELKQFGHLVLGQRLGREQVQRLGTLLHRRGHHRQRVAQRLARSGGRGDDEVAAVPGRLPCLGLVRVERLDTAGAQGFGKRGREIRRQRADIGRVRGDGEVAGDAVAVAVGKPAGQLRPGRHGRWQGTFVDDGVHGEDGGGGPPSLAKRRLTR